MLCCDEYRRRRMESLGPIPYLERHACRRVTDPLEAKLLANIRLVAKDFLFLYVDGNCWPSASLACSDTSGDVLELSVTARMVVSFSRFTIPLQRAPQRSKDISDLGPPDVKSLLSQLYLRVRKALARPSQWRLWVTSLGRLY